MNTPASIKFAALGLALLVNIGIMGGVAHLFNAQNMQPTQVVSLGNTAPLSAESV
jgi:hypothetical protein